MGRGKTKGVTDIRIHRNGGKILRIIASIRFHQDILESEDGEPGLIVVFSLMAGIDDLLERIDALFLAHHNRVDIGLRKLSVLQILAHMQRNSLSRFGMDLKFQNSRNVLTEVQNLLAGGCDHKCGGKPFLLPDGNIVGCGRHDIVFGFSCFSAVAGVHPGINDLAALVIRKPDRTIVAPIPAFIRADKGYFPTEICKLQLKQQLGFVAKGKIIFIVPFVGEKPAGCQFRCNNILAVCKQLRNIVGLILHPLSGICCAGCQQILSHPLPVDIHLIDAAGCFVKPGFLSPFTGKYLAEAIHRPAFILLRVLSGADPLGSPIIRL